jgi:actin-related protein
MSGEIIPVIIDCGSTVLRAGFCGDGSIRCRIAPIVSRDPQDGKAFIGDNAQMKRKLFPVKNPLRSGLIHEWNDMEAIWQHVFRGELRIAPEEHPILLTEPTHTSKQQREKTTEIMFEQFHSPVFYLSNADAMSLNYASIRTGVVVHIGGELTRITPVYQGHALSYASTYREFGGRHLTEQFIRTIEEKQSLDLSSQFDEIDRCKRMRARIARIWTIFNQMLRIRCGNFLMDR